VSGAAIFDLDGVVRRWDPEIMSGAERRGGLPVGVLAAAAFEPTRLDRVVTGVISDEVWRAEITAELIDRFGPSAQSAVAQWSAATGTVDTDVLAVVRMVRRTRPVALLTNATSRLPSDLAALGLLDEVDDVCNSSDLGFAKPDPQVFLRACDRLGAEPSSCWFVDDTERHVRAAARVGMRVHHFTDVATLRAWVDAQAGDSVNPPYRGG